MSFWNVVSLQENSLLYCFNSLANFLPSFGFLKTEPGYLGIATGYGLDRRGSITDRDKELFPFPQRPERLWDPPNLLSNGYKGLFTRGLSVRGVKLTTHL
jgi:hypothetical protein